MFISNRSGAMRPRSSGLLVPGYDAPIVDDHDAPVEDGAVGSPSTDRDGLARSALEHR